MSERPLRKLTTFSEYQIEYSLSHELPYWELFDNLVVLADGSLAMGLELQPIAIETLDSDQINQTTLQIRSLLNALPDGLELSLVAKCDSDFADLLQKHLALVQSGSPIEGVAKHRTGLLESAIKERRLLSSRLHLVVYRRYHPPDTQKQLGFFSPPGKFREIKHEEHTIAFRELTQTISTIRQQLEAIGIGTKQLGQKRILDLIYAFLNPRRSQSEPFPKISLQYRNQEFYPEELKKAPALALSSLRGQLAFSDFILGVDAFYCDAHYHRVITLKTLPEFTYSAFISRLMALPFPHLIHVHVKVPEQSRELATLQAKRRMAHSMSLSQGGRATDLESEAKLHSTEELLRELINTGQKIFYFQLAVLLRTETKNELDHQTRGVLSRIRELGGAEGMAETVAGFKLWKTLLPLGNTTMVRPKRVKSDNLADFLPIYGTYAGSRHGSAKPVCLFQNRAMGLVHYDPFDETLPNYNKLVTGTSGAGKSFVNNLVLLQYYSQNPLVFVIDIGGSYRKLCELLGGQYIEMAPPDARDQVTPINPFHLPQGSREPSPAKLKFLLSLLETLLTDEEGARLHKLEKSWLEQSLLETYAKTSPNSPPTLSHMLELLAASKEPRLRDFSRMLYPWTGDRPYGRLLDAPNALDLTKRFVVFDLKGLSHYPDLQAVMILIITDFILTRIDREPGQRKQILMDECWQLLKGRGSREFMEYCVRTLRKTGSGITFITQGLEEIVANPIGPAILSNTATKFILMQRGDLEPTRKILKLNEQEVALITSLRQSKGHFSECFLIAGEDRAVIRICPTPLEYWLATSDAADNRLLDEQRREAPEKSLGDHITHLAQSYPYGASGGAY